MYFSNPLSMFNNLINDKIKILNLKWFIICLLTEFHAFCLFYKSKTRELNVVRDR